MFKKNAWVSLTCLAMVLVLASGAAVGQDVIKKKDGTIVKGVVTKDTGTHITVQTGKESLTFGYSALDPETVLQLRAKRTPQEDGAGQLKLAEYALKEKLFLAARQHFFYALAADPGLKDQALAGAKKVDVAQRRHIIDMAATARKNGNVQMESALLSHLMTYYPESKEAEEAEKLVAELKTGDDLEAIIARLPKSAQKLIEEGRKAMQEALEYNRRALKNYRKMKAAIADYNRALKRLRRCETILHRIREEYDQNFELMKAAKEAEKKIEDREIQTLVNIAHLYTQRQSFNKALEYANRALLVNENSSLAKETRNRIEMAMSYDRRGGRR